MKWGGVAYLVWLGFVTWRAEPHHFDARADAPQGRDSREVFLKGFLVNITNPKGIIFYVAVLPQFIDVLAAAVRAVRHPRGSRRSSWTSW